MKKILITLSFCLATGLSFAQLSGSLTIPGSYPTIAAAIQAVNTQGVAPGGVIFNVAADLKEGFASPMDGHITLTSGNPVIFRKSGAGINPLITSATGTGAMDAVIAFEGCDNVTFDGIDVRDNPDNDIDTKQMEWGYAILKASASNGSQNITIKNCTVTLNQYYASTVGIYSGNHTSTSLMPLTVSTSAGTNSNLKIFGNTIAGCYSGIFLSGYQDVAAPYNFYDQNNEIGKDGANTITNVGGGAVAAYGIYTKFQNHVKVANNIISSVMEGTQPHYGIFLTTALNGSYDLYGNQVSMTFYGSGSSASFYPVYCDMGGSGTNNFINVYGNTVSGCNYPTAAGTGQNIFFMYLNNLGVTSNVYGNSIINNTVGAPDVTATARVWYLACNMVTSIPGTLNLYNNTITGNSRIQITPGYGLTNFLTANGNGDLLDLHDNLVSDNVVASSGGTNMIYALMNAGTKNIYNNTISNISQAEGTVCGLYYATYTSGSGSVYGNRIRNIEGLTAGSNIAGIYQAAGTYVNYYNNEVSDIRLLNATTSSPFVNQLNGIVINQGTNVGVYHNTVYLSAPQSGGAACGSSAFFVNSSVGVDFRNNIFVNTSIPNGPGKSAAIRVLGSGGLANLSQLSNYNNLYAGIPDAFHLIFSWYDNSALQYYDDMTLSAYQSRVYPREFQSVTELPPFVNIATTPFDLHLKNNVATRCESGGTAMVTPFAVTTDIDNQARFPYSGYPVNAAFSPNAPDIGADEIGGLPEDHTPPAITYTPFMNINHGNARTLTATITDGSGVPVAGIGLPVLYWKINSGLYQGVQGVHIAGGSYNFTFGAGAVLGDVVSYYIVAQDNALFPNVTSYPFIGAGSFSYNPPAAPTPPGTPSSYTIIQGISGVFHVGTGKDFATLTAAASLVNSRVLTGPVTLVLDDAAYPTEVYPVQFNSNPGSNAVNTLTIKPNAGASPVLTTSTATGVLYLNGIDHFILDGSNNGSSGRNLKLSQTNTTTSFSYGIYVVNKDGSDPATNVTIKNCTIQCTPVHSTVKNRTPVLFSFVGGGYDNAIIDNNLIIGGLNGIDLPGTSTAIVHNAQITNNIIGSMTDSLSTVTGMGINLEYADNTVISGNEIIGPYTGSLNPGMTGISINTGCTNTKVRKNRIHEIYNNNPNDGWGACGIEYNSDASSVTEITNNLIYDIKGGGSAPGLTRTNPYGIFINKGGNLKILFNTVSLTGPYLSSLNDASSACIGITHNVVNGSLDIRNNLLINSMVCNGPPNQDGKAYGIILEGVASVFSNIDHNDYYIDGYMGAIAQRFAQSGMTDYFTLPEWQMFTGQDAASVSVNPVCTSNPVLKPTAGALNNLGLTIVAEPEDIAGVLRTNPPDIGAYEFGNDPVVTTTAASSISGSTAVVTGTVNPSGSSLTTYFDYGKTTSYGSTVQGNPGTAGGSSVVGFQAAVSGLNHLTTYHYRARTVTSLGLISYGADMTFTTTDAIPINLDPSGVISNDTCFNASQTITVAGAPNTFTITPTGYVTMIAGQNIRFLPGTQVQPGGYLHGYISMETCNAVLPPAMIAAKIGEPAMQNHTQLSFRVYPNPTAGLFTLDVTGEGFKEKATVEVFSMRGEKIRVSEVSGSGKCEISLAGEPSGIYLLRLVSGNQNRTERIVKR